MIPIGVLTVKQDIKTDETVKRLAGKWLLVPVLGFYLINGGIVVWLLLTTIPLLGESIHARNLEKESEVLKVEVQDLDAKWKEYETAKAYVAKKQIWAKESPGAAYLMSKILTAVPKETKIRGFVYEYRPPKTPAQALIHCQLRFNGNLEVGQVTAALRKIDERLVMLNSRQTLHEDGMILDVDYQVNN